MKLRTRIFPTLLLIGLLSQSASRSLGEDQGSSVEVHAHRYDFSPAEITVRKGETVKVRLFSDDVPHSLLIRGLKVNQSVTKGHPVEFTLTPQSAGDFRGECGKFCGSGHGSMHFIVHVKD